VQQHIIIKHATTRYTQAIEIRKVQKFALGTILASAAVTQFPSNKSQPSLHSVQVPGPVIH
jgi:hypothetical protein